MEAERTEIAATEETEVADFSFWEEGSSGGICDVLASIFRISSDLWRLSECIYPKHGIDTSSFDDVTRRILAAAIEVHRTLGPGLLESTYMPCFEDEMTAQKLDFVRGRVVPITCKGKALGQNYFVDLFVENKVVVEVKSVSMVLPVHHSQTLTYMRLLNAPAGLLINFNVPKLMDGVKRLINPRAVDSVH